VMRRLTIAEAAARVEVATGASNARVLVEALADPMDKRRGRGVIAPRDAFTRDIARFPGGQTFACIETQRVDADAVEQLIELLKNGKEKGTSTKRGRKPKADWEAIEEAFAARVLLDGYPDARNVKGWSQQSDVEEWISGLVEREGVSLAESTLRRRAKEFMTRVHKDQ
jgi:hypothetical protein